jgi:signal transduction histidine kinase
MTRPRPVCWLRDHPGGADALLAALLVAMSVVIHLTIHDPDLADPNAFGVFLCVAGAAPLAWRRRSPEIVLAVVLIVQLVNEASEWIGSGWVAVLIAAYSVGTVRAGRTLWWVGSVATAVVIAVITVGIAVDDVPWQSLLTTPVLFVSAFTLGDNMRRRRERATELVERAERAERERELLAHQQVQLERTRIARELHDVVAHSVSVMVIQAGAARRQLASNPTMAHDALESIEATGREAMSEMRRILGVLRSDEALTDLTPQPTLASLAELVAGAPDLAVTLRVAADLAPVPAAVEVSAYRVVQEALTNVRRHAGRVDHVSVDVSMSDDQLVVEVVDDGRGVSAATFAGNLHPGELAGRATGFGLTGMRERVGMFGGDLVAGERRGGGWRVRARFPVRAASSGVEAEAAIAATIEAGGQAR